MRNNLRNRIVLRTDGGMRTGEDIASGGPRRGGVQLRHRGAHRARVCLRAPVPPQYLPGGRRDSGREAAASAGTLERVVNFFNSVAEEVRQIMAQLGVRSLTDLIGRPQYQATRGAGSSEGEHARPLASARGRGEGQPRRAALLHPRAQRRPARTPARRDHPSGCEGRHHRCRADAPEIQ